MYTHTVRNYSFVISESDQQQGRLDKLLAQLLAGEHLSRSQLERAIRGGFVSLNGDTVVRPAHQVSAGDRIELQLPEPRSLSVAADPTVPFSVVYRDEDIIVINKPPGVVVHPGAGAHEGTLVSGLLHLLGDDLPRLAGAFRPGIVHRLDKDTSGLMVVALTERAWTNLQQQFKPPRTIERTYLAVTLQKPRTGKGSVTGDSSGTISLPIGRDSGSRIKMSSRSSNPRSATTHWEIYRELKHGLILSCKLETGRTHQIRTHLAETGAPIVGDKVYGKRLGSFGPEIQKRMNVINRQALHAQKLAFLHPQSNDRIFFESELPDDIMILIEALER